MNLTLLPKQAAAEMRAAQADFKSRIICGDVLKLLSKQSTETQFDVVIADPPYNIGKDFGNNNDTMPLEDYVEWAQNWLAECFRLLADNGIIYVYGFPEILARIAVKYPIDNQRWLVWHYTNKTTPSSQFWQRSHESILCLWKSNTARPTLEIDQIREPYTDTFLNCAGKKRAATKSRFSGKNTQTTIYKVHKNGALPRDVFKIPALAGGAGACERWFMCNTCGGGVYSPKELKAHKAHDIMKHPTQKPFNLTNRLLLSKINGKGRTLIPFAGSGSECVAAEKLGVDYLGFEINPIYVDFANKWLKKMRVKQCTN